jgi:excinuclease ABC subunit B
MYADNMTKSIRNAVSETDRRRNLQIDYNRKHDITPRTINKAISDILYNSGIKTTRNARRGHKIKEKKKGFNEGNLMAMGPGRIATILSGLEEEMNLEARDLNFEKAAMIRDEIKRIKKITSIEIR